jgi:cytidylate kinase
LIGGDVRRTVICISHSTGAGGEEVGRRVAEQLDMRYLDEEIVGRAAAASGVSPEELRDSERRKGAVEKLFRYFGEAALSTDGSLPAVADHTDAHRTLIREAIEATAKEGNAVIVAHAASLTLGTRADVLRVLVTASPETRARRIAEEQGGESAARDLIRKSDAGRAAYLRSFYGVSQELPTHYDLVVNTDHIAVEEAGGLLAALATAAGR